MPSLFKKYACLLLAPVALLPGLLLSGCSDTGPVNNVDAESIRARMIGIEKGEDRSIHSGWATYTIHGLGSFEKQNPKSSEKDLCFTASVDELYGIGDMYQKSFLIESCYPRNKLPDYKPQP